MSKILDNHELAMLASGALIVAFEKRGDIEGTFDPAWMCAPIEDAIAAAVQAEREACAKVADNSPARYADGMTAGRLIAAAIRARNGRK